jgi:iron complex transport system substrate-binding protein
MIGTSQTAERICSLLPSATEIVYALGLGDRLVGVTHECDYPPEAETKPRVTASIVDSESLGSAEIDAAVRESLAAEATIYRLDRGILERLRPDLVITQELCTVCAVGTGTVQDVVSTLPERPEVLSLEPRTLSEVLDSMLRVGRLTGTLRTAIDVVDGLRRRIEAVREAVAGRKPVRALTLEWIDPIFVGGHWVPEMVQIAGGVDLLGTTGAPSHEVSWERVAEVDPDAVVVMLCGFGLDRSMRELTSAALPEAWNELRAVREGCVFVVDGSSYFSRPGPRLVDGVEILAAIFHPDVVGGRRAGQFQRYDRPPA